MTQGQKICRKIAYAFSIVGLVCYGLMFFIFLIDYAVYKNIFYEDMGSGILLAGVLVFVILAIMQVPLLFLNIKISKDEYSHVALGVCNIVFGGLVSGILILCSGGKQRIRNKAS
jgi:hypothetical protein